jgi:hypothetical protein
MSFVIGSIILVLLLILRLVSPKAYKKVNAAWKATFPARMKILFGCVLPTCAVIIGGLYFMIWLFEEGADGKPRIRIFARNTPPASSFMDYEETREEKKMKRSAKELNANAAKINSLVTKIDSQQAAIDNATTNDDKIRGIDALLGTFESALEITKDTISILEENRKDGYVNLGFISQSQLQESLDASKGTERAVLSKITELKKERAGLLP